MIQKTVQDICKMIDASYYANGLEDRKIKGVSIDSRTIEADMLYIPLLGQRVDGHQFIDSVIEKGAGASFWQKDHLPYPKGILLILVEDPQKALQDLAKAYLKTLDCLVIAVTGSNGKTSCKDMLFSVFSKEKKTQKTQGNRNNEIGLPLTILEFDEDIEVAILEMGMENRFEIEQLCQIAPPDISIITTIGSAHMENLGDRYGIARAKLEILENSKPNALFLYNKECPEIESVMKEMEISSDHNIVSFGQGGDIFVSSDVQVTDHGISFQVAPQNLSIELAAYGDFQATNALPVIYAALYAKLSEASILEGLKTLEMTKMRTQLIPCQNAKILDDTYKSNPESARAAIDTLMSIPAKRHVAILSDMLDLGPDTVQFHQEIGTYAIDKQVDQVYCVGELSKHTAAACQEKGMWFEDKTSLLAACRQEVENDCVILVKGSRAMTMDTIVEALQEG